MQGHKFAIKEIRAGEEIVKYGYPIGVAKVKISSGQWIHTHNMRTKLDENEVMNIVQLLRLKRWESRYFFKGICEQMGAWEHVMRYGLFPQWAA